MSHAEIAQPSTYSRMAGIAGILLAHSLALCFVMLALVKIVPTYEVFFEVQEVALPVATRRIVMWSEFWVAYWFILFFLAMFIDAAVVLALAFAASRRQWILSAYSHGCLLAACALIVYISAWLSHPVYDSVRPAAAVTAEQFEPNGIYFVAARREPTVWQRQGASPPAPGQPFSHGLPGGLRRTAAMFQRCHVAPLPCCTAAMFQRCHVPALPCSSAAMFQRWHDPALANQSRCHWARA